MAETGEDVPALARRALAEVGAVFTPETPGAATRLGDEILAARRIACHGVGRAGLMMRALCMWLMHLGLDAHVVGDMTPPPVGPGDLLLVSAGPGTFSVEGCRRLADDLRGRTALPVRWVLDVGHALNRPLYGEAVSLADWLAPLGDDTGVLHLQNHDFRSDAHWGWPDARGGYDVAAFAAEVREAGLGHGPVIVELFYPFGLADEAVLANVAATVRHCAAELRA